MKTGKLIWMLAFLIGIAGVSQAAKWKAKHMAVR